jgi:hypothetical protein
VFIRFVVGGDDAHHRALTGVITEARLLRDRGELSASEAARLHESYAWSTKTCLFHHSTSAGGRVTSLLGSRTTLANPCAVKKHLAELRPNFLAARSYQHQRTVAFLPTTLAARGR